MSGGKGRSSWRNSWKKLITVLVHRAKSYFTKRSPAPTPAKKNKLLKILHHQRSLTPQDNRMINIKSWAFNEEVATWPLRILRIISASSRHRRSLRKLAIGKGQPRNGTFTHGNKTWTHGPMWGSTKTYNVNSSSKCVCVSLLHAVIFDCSQTWSRNTSAGAVEAKACSPNLSHPHQSGISCYF